MDIDEQIALGRRLGPLHVHPAYADAERPEVLVIHADANSKHAAGEAWHSDVSCEPQPPAISMLRMEIVPESGGDTLFADMYQAYESLSPAMQELPARADGTPRVADLLRRRPAARRAPGRHPPVVRTHPVTGRRALYVNSGFTKRIVELRSRESDALLKMLYDHIAYEVVNQIRVHWEPDTVVLWDNRCVQHHAAFDYFPAVRHGYRVHDDRRGPDAGAAVMSAGLSTRDWSTDYDIFDPAYVTEPYPVWDELRRTCPVAHSDRYGASWLPTRYDDVAAIAHDVEHFSSRSVSVITPPEDEDEALPARPPADLVGPAGAHVVATAPAAVVLAPACRPVRGRSPASLCQRLAADIVERGRGDAAVDYAQQIPARVIAGVLGVPADLADTFTGWVRDVLEFAHDEERRRRGRIGILTYLTQEIEVRRTNPGRRPHQRPAARRGRRRTRARRPRPRHRRAHADRRRRHHVELDRLVAVAPRHPPRRPPAASSPSRS